MKYKIHCLDCNARGHMTFLGIRVCSCATCVGKGYTDYGTVFRKHRFGAFFFDYSRVVRLHERREIFSAIVLRMLFAGILGFSLFLAGSVLLEESREVFDPNLNIGISGVITPDLVKDRNALNKLFGDCGDPCVIKYSRGGYTHSYLTAANAIKKHRIRRHLIIDGECDSACVTLADKARPYVCITSKAVFGVHKVRNRWKEYFDPTDEFHSEDILTYVAKHGGFPKDYLLFIPYKDALAFWPSCDNYVSPK